MKIQLINPAHPQASTDRLDAPCGLLHIATVLQNYLPYADIVINDLSGTKCNGDIRIPKADTYGITVYCATLPQTKHIINQCRQTNPDCKIVLGGAHISAMPDTFADIADFAVVGHGELAMVEICTSSNKLPKIIQGTPMGGPIDINWDFVDLDSYSRTINGKKSVPILTSRGCKFRCNFCGMHVLHGLQGGVKFYEAGHVISHLRKIKDLGVSSLNIQDDIFTMHPQLDEILSGIKKLGMTYRCMSHVSAPESVYAKLADSGCQGVAWGIESGSQRILDLMNKGTKVQDGFNAIKWCKKYGMDSRAFMILGFPGENKFTIEETRQFIVDADPDQYFISNFIPYPGTPVWENPVKFGIISMCYDFDEYYQVNASGTGGTVISTKWLYADELMAEELTLRQWLKENKPLRGVNLQEYEK